MLVHKQPVHKLCNGIQHKTQPLVLSSMYVCLYTVCMLPMRGMLLCIIKFDTYSKDFNLAFRELCNVKI